MKPTIVAFDLDGVIINSLKNMQYSWERTSKKNNLNINFKKYKKYIGLPFETILHKLNIRGDLIKIKKNYSFYSNQKISKIKLYPKIITVLKKLKKKYNYKCCYYDYHNNKIESYRPKEKNPFNFYFINKNHAN
jgi:beta-phosphoglucomutase-like phosphatase (HAD superfamily)